MARKPRQLPHLEYLRKHCSTDRQEQYLDAVIEHGGIRPAARALGVAYNAVAQSLSLVRGRATMAGEGDHFINADQLPNPLAIKGTSTLYGEDGLAKVQWVKTTVDADKKEAAVKAWIEALTEDIRGRAPLTAPPAFSRDEFLVAYCMGDPHFGLYSWAGETGEDFNLAEAERRTTASIDRLVSATRAASTALLINLGDFFHADDASNRTPASGHALDVDTRYAKVMHVGIRAMQHAIFRLLEKHQKVIVWNVVGNHDPHASIMLAMCLRAYFHNEPRVEIPVNPSLYSYHRFGKVLIGAHHGHGAKMGDLPLLMAADRPEDWGATQYRYWYCGHIHHKQKDKEHPGVVVETFNSMTGSDAWHHGKGYRAQKSMTAIVHHRDQGERERHICGLSQIMETADAQPG